jgi:hypothetical protein
VQFDNIFEDFTSVFGVSEGLSGLVQGMWLLDHKHFEVNDLVTEVFMLVRGQYHDTRATVCVCVCAGGHDTPGVR